MIEGHWEGFYEMEGLPGKDCNEWGMQKFRVEAWFEIHGRTITGHMLDLDNSYETRYSDFVEMYKDKLSWIDARNAESYAREFPEAMRIVNGCPDSVLDGKIIGNDVEFQKMYTGTNEIKLIYGNEETITRIPGGMVNYFGKLLDSDSSIKGTYTTVPSQHYAFSTGYFELRKVEE